MLAQLESPEALARQVFGFVIPCLNLSGYVENTRENVDGVDINRSMEREDVAEAVLLRKNLSGRQFGLYVDMHKDYDADGFYMCEAEKEGRLVGEEIVAAVGGVGALDTDDEDDNEEPVGPGRYPVSDR